MHALRLSLALPLLALASFTAADELSAPVTVLTSAPPAPAMMQPNEIVREEAPPATPGARMPQYQLHHVDRGDAADPASPVLRFILALPERPLLVEYQITINGQPFRQSREQRVQEILRYLADPAKIEAELEAKRVQTAELAAKAAAEQAAVLAAATPIEVPVEPEPVPAAAPSETPPAPETPEGAAQPEEPAAEATPAEATPTEPAKPEEAKAEEEKPAEPMVPAGPKYEAPATVFERALRYTQATGQPADADEVRWLLTNWVDGPVLLFLNDNFQRYRADQKPVFKVLDQDRDGKISAAELQRAVTLFQECDLDRNDVVEATELAQVADDPRDKPVHAGPGNLVFRLPTATNAAGFYRRLAARYAASDKDVAADSPRLPRFDSDADGTMNAAELQALHDVAADIRLTVDFNTQTTTSSKITITDFGPEFTSLRDAAHVNSASVTLGLAQHDVEFLAVQSAESDQISIGAIEDGYKMLPELDPNNDGRFSIRELRELNARLAKFDRNQDGEVTADESRPTYRVCLGLGPTADQALAMIRSGDVTDTAQPAGPEWFVEMDKNKDHDLTRNEFPGTDEQFAQLDSDSDKLISAVEANATP